jgi:hypothetical protein
MSEVDELGETLRQAVSRTCSECGLENVSFTDLCARCGHQLPPVEAERSLSFKEGALVYEKGNLEDSWNLKVLRLAQETLAAGTIDLEEYRQHVTHVLEPARAFLETLEEQAESLEDLDDTGRAIVGRTLVHYQAFVSGCERMLEASGENPAPAQEGYQLVFQALKGLDRAEDEATDRLRELLEAEEQPEEEEEAE